MTVAYSGLAWKYSLTSSSASGSTFVTAATLPVLGLIFSPSGQHLGDLLADELEELPAGLQAPPGLRAGPDGGHAVLHQVGPLFHLLVPVGVRLVPHVVGDLVVVAALTRVPPTSDQADLQEVTHATRDGRRAHPKAVSQLTRGQLALVRHEQGAEDPRRHPRQSRL